MRSERTFKRGGVEPLDHKEITSRLPIQNSHIPAVAVMPLAQHAGAPAVALVSAGDWVKEGMLIARAGGFVSANIHSPIPGKVTEVHDITLPDGRQSPAIVIECAGEFDRSGKILSRQSWEELDGETLNGIIAEMGVIGLGGAGFPTHAKYAPWLKQSPVQLIVNGVECEPYLTGEHRLMLEKPTALLEGIAIIQKIVRAREVIIAVEENKPDALEVLGEKIAEKTLPYRLHPVAVRYPQGDERLLARTIAGRTVKAGMPPAASGVLVSNVSTVFAVYEAVAWRKPLIERVITVTGPIVAQPSNVKARLGTKIGELIEDCGGFTEPPAKVVMGGPLRGLAAADLDAPLTKGVSGLICFGKRDLVSYPDQPCLRCGRCLRACPAGLCPATLYKLIKYERREEALAQGLDDCSECGCCAYVCPARIPLVRYFKAGKTAARIEA